MEYEYEYGELMKSYAKIFEGREAAQAFYHLVSCDHVFEWMDDRLKTLMALHDFGTMIETGHIIVIGCLNERGLQGIHYGSITNNVLYDHVFFKRKIKDSLEMSEMAVQELKKKFPDITKIVGTIPVKNRQSRVFALKSGFVNMGITDKFIFINEGGRESEVYLFEREI